MKKLRIYGFLFLGLWSLSVTAKAQKANKFSLQQAVDYAKQHSVQVKNALLDILIQKQLYYPAKLQVNHPVHLHLSGLAQNGTLRPLLI